MRIYTIDALIANHWRGCDVQAGETPEDYASRHEEEVLALIHSWILEAHSLSLDLFRTEGGV